MKLHLPWKANVHRNTRSTWTIWITDATGEEIMPWTAFDSDGHSFTHQSSKARMIAAAVNRQHSDSFRLKKKRGERMTTKKALEQIIPKFKGSLDRLATK